MPDDLPAATRARLELRTSPNLVMRDPDVVALLAAYNTLRVEHQECADWERVNALLDERDALLAERAQAAPVLAAAEAWVDGLGVYGQAKVRWDRLMAAIAAWRAAREG